MGGVLAVFLMIAFAWAAPALSAERRVALVIGNAAYQNVPKLANPVNDADAVAALFRQAHFDLVETKRDLNITEMRRALRDFANKTRDADIAVVYFAGHGIEVDGQNYLVPTDAVLEQDRDAFDETILLDRVLQAAEPAKQLRLIILDACRDNPFGRSMKRTLATRSVGRGLAVVEPTRSNTMVAYAARSGSTAIDGSGSNSPFTSALVKHLATPGLDLRKAFGLVRDDVMRATGDRQEPYVYGSLGGTDISLVPAAPVATPVAPVVDPIAAVRRDYELALQIGTRDAWAAFLQQYTSGLYANLARSQIAKLDAEERRVAAAEAARVAESEKIRLASEGARAAEQARAARDARDAEEKRLAAERAKAAEQAKTEAAERERAVLEKAAAEKLARDRAAAEAKAASDAKVFAEAKATAEAKLLAEAKAVADAKAAAEERRRSQVAALPAEPTGPVQTPEPLNRQLQSELRRVGCLTGDVSDDWTATSKRALEQFSTRAGKKLDAASASPEALDAVKGQTGRVCPVAAPLPKAPRLAVPAVAKPVRERPIIRAAAPRPVANVSRSAPATPASGGGGKGCFNFNGRQYCE